MRGRKHCTWNCCAGKRDSDGCADACDGSKTVEEKVRDYVLVICKEDGEGVSRPLCAIEK